MPGYMTAGQGWFDWRVSDPDINSIIDDDAIYIDILVACEYYNYFIVNEVIIIVKLANITIITTGYPFRGKIPEKSGGGVRVVQMKDVSSENGICWSSVVETELTGKNNLIGLWREMYSLRHEGRATMRSW